MIRCSLTHLPNGFARAEQKLLRKSALRSPCSSPRTACHCARCSRRRRARDGRGCGRAKAPIPTREEAKHTAELVAARVPEIPKWWFAFQSQGASGGPWIGPTVEETLTRLPPRA